MLQFEIVPYTLQFNKPAKTSRNVFEERQIYVIRLWNKNEPKIIGTGEAAPLAKLSIDDVPDYKNRLNEFCLQLCENGNIEALDLDKFPSIRFGLETALLDLKHGGKGFIFPQIFQNKPVEIPINGLVWMAEADEMLEEALDKPQSGFDCIKFKVGALDFDAECRMLEQFRKQFSASKILIRLDANGAFATKEAMEKLKELHRFEIQSIEQPIAAKHWDDMARLCRDSKIDIALDEELIGLRMNSESENYSIKKMLQTIQPQFLVIKHSLIGGFIKTDNIISEANKMKIGWWATSALESNIGLNAIAQWTLTHHPKNHQGLGTGSLYKNNFEMDWTVEKGFLRHHSQVT